MPLPPRLVYLTSGLEAAGRVHLDDLQWERRAWNGTQAYCDSKLYDVLLAFAVARRYPRLRSNAVDPGWIKTKLGGQGATDELPVGAQTQVWLAVSDDRDADVTGRYSQVAPRPASQPGRLRHRPAGGAARRLRPAHRHRAARLGLS